QPGYYKIDYNANFAPSNIGVVQTAVISSDGSVIPGTTATVDAGGGTQTSTAGNSIVFLPAGTTLKLAANTTTGNTLQFAPSQFNITKVA
ncbi:MAG: hypothetical protein LBC65_00155, partial [Oscillospiraceae bacterium]|nr:hypothetical protein [Oscillospiraceae bacterium]